MISAEKSLHVLVEKWLGAARLQPEQGLLIRRSRAGGLRRICIEAHCASGPLTLFFFRHEDGCWHMFPPATRRPAMRIDALAA